MQLTIQEILPYLVCYLMACGFVGGCFALIKHGHDLSFVPFLYCSISSLVIGVILFIAVLIGYPYIIYRSCLNSIAIKIAKDKLAPAIKRAERYRNERR